MSFVPLERVWPNRFDPSELRTKGQVSTGYTRFEEGDIVVPKITPTFQADRSLRVTGLHGGVGAGTTELHVVRARAAEPGYVRYLLSSHPFLVGGEAAMIGVAGQKRVPETWIKDLPVPVADRSEQRRISEFLDAETERIEQLITIKNRMIELLEERRVAAIEALLGGEDSVELRRLADILPGYTFPSSEFGPEIDGPRLLRGTNVGVGQALWDDLVRFSGDASRVSDYRLRPGDVVLGMDRPFIGAGTRVFVFNEREETYLVQRVCRIRLPEPSGATVVAAALASPRFQALVEADLTGVSVPHLSGGQIGEAQVPAGLVSSGYAEDLASRIEQVSTTDQALRGSLRRQIELLRERRRSLITAAVTGELA